MKRRRFLGVSLLGAALWPMVVFDARAVRAPGLRELHADVLGLFAPTRRPRVIGNEYLACFPEEADLHALLAAVFAGASLSRAPATERAHSRGGLRRFLYARIADDFANGETVCVCGWILARTEARLCALTALA